MDRNSFWALLGAVVIQAVVSLVQGMINGNKLVAQKAQLEAQDKKIDVVQATVNGHTTAATQLASVVGELKGRLAEQTASRLKGPDMRGAS